ncbi:MAG: hypothetical protein RLZZ387_2055 [Chloroflexota bacterium]
MNALNRTWCSHCERSLMIRSAAREKRSPWLAALGGLWVLGGVLGILVAVGTLVLALIAFFTLKSTLGPKANVPFPLGVLAGVVLSVLISVGQITVARAAMDRQRWAYVIVAGGTLLGLLSALFGALLGAAPLREALAGVNPRAIPGASAQALAAVAAGVGAALMAGVGAQGLMALLVGLSWGDFFGPRVRFMPEVQGSDDAELFNFGLACKARKMWFMAVRQWEATVRKAGRDPEYLHALGLAYAQLGWLEQAHEMVTRAVAVEPKNEAIQLSLARLERARAKH